MQDEHNSVKKALYQELATIGKAFASPFRLEFIELLSQKEHSVEELANKVGMEVANASQHFQKLKQAKLVEARKEGTKTYYRLAEAKVIEVWSKMQELALSRNAEMERLMKALHQENSEVGLDPNELLKKVEDEELVLVDVRPEDEFKAGHIAEALSCPLDRIEQELERLPKDRTIVAYCRGPFCVMSDQAVETLKKHGYKATSYKEGFSGWIEKGLPMEKANYVERRDEH